MIYIITENTDITTNSVIEWLLHQKKKVKRLNETEIFKNFNLEISNTSTQVNFNGIKAKNIWHRRGKLNIVNKSNIQNISIYNYLKIEADSLIKSIELYYKDSKNEYVGSFLKEKENYKLQQLQTAKSVGLNIPETLVTTSKKELIEFKKKYKKIISKDIRYPSNINLDGTTLTSTGVKVVTNKMTAKLDEFFFPIFCQKLIEKKYEIRLFFFKNKFYPMAIFSQKNKKTQIDFRNYDSEQPNRCVPIILPKDLIKKIKIFNKLYEINTGSIDLIYTKNNEYLFLEVNPQGQFDWLSKSCNYYIEKYIADFFTY